MNYQRYGIAGREVGGTLNKPWPYHCMITLVGFDLDLANLAAEHNCTPLLGAPSPAGWTKICAWEAVVPRIGFPTHEIDVDAYVLFKASVPTWAFMVRVRPSWTGFVEAQGFVQFQFRFDGDLAINGSFQSDLIPNPNNLVRKWSYRVGLWTQFPPEEA